MFGNHISNQAARIRGIYVVIDERDAFTPMARPLGLTESNLWLTL
jgi:hypothetical protein